MTSSRIHRDEIVINDDSRFEDSVSGVGCGTGLDLGLRGPAEYAYGDVATAFDPRWLIPQSEWQARIQEMEERQSLLSDHCTAVKMPCLNQERTNYCWANAPVYATQVVRSQQNEAPVLLSPASVAAPIKGFRNVGGWGKEALEWIVQRGVVPVSQWPANAIDQRYDTAAARQMATGFRVVEWIELRPRDLNQLVSILLRRIPVAVGFNWWGHEVTAIDPVWLDGTIAIRIRNSWGSNWGNDGYGILQGSKMLPDDAVAPRTTLAGTPRAGG